MWLLLLASGALAAPPSPDRPSVSQTSALVAKDTLELEAGGAWSGRFSTPLLLKYGAGFFEPRVGFDPLLMGTGAASAFAGAKIAVLNEGRFALTGALASTVPVAAGDPWAGTARVLANLGFEHGSLQVNAGVDFVAPHLVLGVDGLPFAVAYGFDLGDKLDGFVEAAAVLDAGLRDRVIDGGLAYPVTDSVLVDVGIGWSFDDGQPLAQIGVTANLGRLTR